MKLIAINNNNEVESIELNEIVEKVSESIRSEIENIACEEADRTCQDKIDEVDFSVDDIRNFDRTVEDIVDDRLRNITLEDMKQLHGDIKTKLNGALSDIPDKGFIVSSDELTIKIEDEVHKAFVALFQNLARKIVDSNV